VDFLQFILADLPFISQMRLSPYPPFDINDIGCPCCEGWDTDWRTEQMYKVLDKFTRQWSESQSSIEIELDDGRVFKL
jgi:hypothetical protein